MRGARGAVGFDIWTAAIKHPATVVLSVALAALAPGCISQSPRLPTGLAQSNPRVEQPGCRKIRSEVEDVVSRSQVGDAETRRIAGQPYLRINRFLAHLGRKFRKRQSGKGFRAWLIRLRQLDGRAIRIEIANLPPIERRRLRVGLFGGGAPLGRVASAYDDCGDAFVAQVLQYPGQKRRLVGAAKVADDYSNLAQAAGLYPLTSIPVAAGWENWKRKHLTSFRRPVAELPVRGTLVEWAPPLAKNALTARRIRSIVDNSRDGALGIPEPKGRDLKRLFDAFAPIWQVDVTGNYDQIGHPGWINNGSAVGLDQRRPVVFTRVSHAVVNDQILLQLNYSIWFRARPRTGPLDLLGGHLDGVIWRVTLAGDGQPLIYDSIHACGCYHLLFPLKAGISARARQPNSSLKELPAIVSGTRAPRAGQRVLLRLASATHYLRGVTVVDPTQIGQMRATYRMIDDNVLRSLPVSHGRRRSLFDENGLVAGTERLERFLLWPTGVNSPGALRQWGRHAIAFADRRHFDDPILFERIFNY